MQSEPTTVNLGPIRVDSVGKRLLLGEQRLDADAQQVDVLLCLIRAYPAIVSKDSLINEVWGGRFVTDAALHKTISELRKVLREASDGQEWIETRHRRGYQLVAMPDGQSWPDAANPGVALALAETADPAMPPAEPGSNKRLWQILALAVLGGLLIWVGTAVLNRDQMQHGVGAASDVASAVASPDTSLPRIAPDLQARLDGMAAAELVQTIRGALGQDEALVDAAIAELFEPRLAAEMPDHQAMAAKFKGIHAYRQGNFELAMAGYRDALAGFVRSGNQREEANVLNNMGVLHSESGRDPEQAAQWFQRSREIRESLNDAPAVLASNKNLANLWLTAGRFQDAREPVAAYVTASRLNGAPVDQIDALLLQGDVALGLGDADAASWFEQALALAMQSGEALLAASAMQRLGRLALRSGRADEARTRFLEALSYYDQSPDSHQRAIVVYNLATAEESLGNATAARDHYRDAQASAPDPNSSLAIDAALGQVRMLWRLDQEAAASTLLTALHQRVLTLDQPGLLASVQIHRSILALMQEQALSARALLQEARRAIGQHADWELLVTLQEQEIWVHLALSEHEAAARALELLREQARTRGDTRVLQRLQSLEQFLQVARGAIFEAYSAVVLSRGAMQTDSAPLASASDMPMPDQGLWKTRTVMLFLLLTTVLGGVAGYWLQRFRKGS